MNSLLTNHLGRRVVLRPEVLRISAAYKSQPLFSGQRYSVLAQHKKACPWLKRSCWSSTTYKFCDGQVVSQRSIVTTPKEDFNSCLPKKKINIEDKVNSRRLPLAKQKTQRSDPQVIWHPPPRRSEVHNLKRIIVKPLNVAISKANKNKPTTRRLSNILEWYPTGV